MPASDKPAEPIRAKEERAERLSAALRENLKRRKAQARAKERREGHDSAKDRPTDD
jgi:hypothetical protein